MNNIYIVTILVTYILLMLIHKTEKKQNAIAWLAVSAILILCYNTFICVIGTFMGMLCTLKNLSICNIVMIVLLSGIILKNKKIQKYYLKISDLLVSIFILILIILIAYKQYGFPFNLKYQITDASTHYYYAELFCDNSTLLYKIENNNLFGIDDSDFRLPGAYTNEGILFKTFEGIISRTDLFILFDLFVLYLSGILIYYLLKTYAKGNKKLQIFAVIFAILYMLAYQLNSMLYGFVYLSLALDIVIAFLLITVNYEKEETLNIKELVMLSLLSFGIFFTYAYFIPIIYISVIINIIIKSRKKQEHILSENNSIELMLIIVNPLILGLTYFIILPAAKGIANEISTIGNDGGIYRNYITNLLFLLPIFITGIILEFKGKRKENSFPKILFVLSILYAIILLIGKKLNIVSSYYYFKVYYIIWPIALYNAYIILCEILESENKQLKIATYSYGGIYLATIIIATIIIPCKIGINDIFYRNMQCIKDSTYTFKDGELEVFETIEKGTKIYTLPPKTIVRKRWMTALCNNPYIQFDIGKNIDEWLKIREEQYYFACHADYKKIESDDNYLDENSGKYEIIYNDEYVFIVERKGE